MDRRHLKLIKIMLALLFCLSSCIVPAQADPVISISTSSPSPLVTTTPTVVISEIEISDEVVEPGRIEDELVILRDSRRPIFDKFIKDLKTGEADKVVGLWVENVMALQVVYQPDTNPAFVSSMDDIATYFLMPWQKAANHGLLAHNYLAGRYFFDIKVGDILTLVFGDGDYLDFEVKEIKEYQALQPQSPYTNFIDQETGEQLTVSNVFIEVYMGDFHTTLQTCIAVGDETEWGRQFIIAPPL